MNSVVKPSQANATVPETWEIETLERQFPQFSRQQIRTALEDCKRELGANVARERMMSCVESKLK